MSADALLWILLNLIAVAVSAYYSMIEMACVSFNKVRLQYYVSKGIKQAVWLNALLNKPARLFGTTLIGVNAANVISSECAREFYSSIGLSPDLAPLTQVPIVVIFGELAPMFAARHFPEHVVMLGIRALHFSAIAMKPLLWIISGISIACHWIIGGSKDDMDIFLTQEELLTILEQPDRPSGNESDDYNRIAYNIFQLRHLTAKELMRPLSEIKLLSSNSTVGDMRAMIANSKSTFFPVYHRSLSKIVGIAYTRDLLRASENQRVRNDCRSAWFITRNTDAMQILQQFRRNNQTVAVVLDHRGSAIGIVTLDMLIEKLIAFSDEEEDLHEPFTTNVLMDLTVPGDMTVREFNQQFEVQLDEHDEWTLAYLMQTQMDHSLEEGDAVIFEPYQLTVKEATMTEVKTITISTQLS